MPSLRIAHRGWHGRHPENTLEALLEAYTQGCDMVEFDVQLSKDGEPIVFHDDDCRRMCGLDAPIHSLTREEIRRIPIRRDNEEWAIPELRRFLAVLGDKPYYLEMKVPRAKAEDHAYLDSLAAATLEVLGDFPRHPQTFLASFHLPLLRRVRLLDPRMPLVPIFENHRDFSRYWKHVQAGGALELAGVAYFSLPWAAYRRVIGMPDAFPPADLPRSKLLVWNIEGYSRLCEAALEGVGGLVSDDGPSLIRLPSE